MHRRVWLLAALVATLSGCAQSGNIFPDPGDNVATPSAMWVDPAAGRLYLVNSNAKVLYDWTKGSFQVLNIADPLAPVLLDSVETASYSGQIYVDAALQQAFVPNRFSTDAEQTVDRLYVFNLDEAATDFLSFETEPMGRDAYAIQCCYPANRAWITTSLGELQFIDVTNPAAAAGSLNLMTTLDSGGELSHAEVNHIAIRNAQAFLSREYGGVMVANLDKAGDTSGAAPVDYFIGDVPNPRGIATDGTYIYVVSEGDDGDGNWVRQLLVLDPASLTPLSGNTTTVQLDKDDDGLLVAAIDVGESPQEVLLTTAYAFVTNQNDDTVSAIDLATRAVVATIPVGDQPFSLGLYTTAAQGDRYLYVGNVFSNTLSIVDIATLAMVAVYP